MNQLGARLRAELRDERHALAPVPGATARIVTLVARRRRRRALATAVVVVAALSAVVSLALRLEPSQQANLPLIRPSNSPTALPWLDAPTEPPSPTPQPTRAPTTPCVAADLSHAANAGGGPAAGNVGFKASVTNVSGRRCTLTASGQVRGTDLTTGESLTLTSSGRAFLDNPVDDLPPTLDPGDRALITVAGATGCNSGLNLHTYRFTELTVAGRQDSITFPDLDSSCAPYLGSWYRPAPDSHAIPNPPNLPLQATIQAPLSATRGSQLRYQVTLSNPTGAPVSLDPCPAYTEQLDKSQHIYRLNCAVATIPPGGSIAYAMVLPLPADPQLLPSGERELTWGIGYFDPLTCRATARVTITG